MRQQQVSVRNFAFNVGWGALLLTIVALCAANCTSGGAAEQDSGIPNADVTTIGPCGPGVNAMCNGTCVDISSDYQNCGQCGNACPNDQVCSHGTCAVVCGGGSVRCGNNCVDLGADPQNCGGCSKACATGEVCNKATCALTCQQDLTNCNGGCVDVTSDDFNCNTCGNACPSGSQCVSSVCQATCQSGWSSCGNGEGGTTCVDTTDDPENCGGCGAKCPNGYFCSPGADGGPACGLQCSGGTSLCSNACVDESLDPNHCGGCNTTCPGGDDCSGGHCCPNATPFYCPAESKCDTLINCIQKTGGAITAGQQHTCAINASGALKCWGYNGNGELGVGTTTNSSSPQATLGLTTGVVGVAAWYDGTCATTTSGATYCWGYGAEGELGNGGTASSTSPVQVSGISSGLLPSGGGYYGGNCVLLKSGGVDCWGYDEYGELGLGSVTLQDYTTPQVSKVTGAVSIAGTPLFFEGTQCAVLASGSVQCWGYGIYTLGDGTTTESGNPITVTGISNAAQVAVGYENTCVVLKTGAMKCWGYDFYGQNGDGTTTTTDSPVNAATISNIVQACVGDDHTCVVTSGGAVECVGYNLQGQLGNNTTTSSTSWVTAIASGAASVACGSSHTCALMANGTAKCWGSNGDGQLGDGTTTQRNAPVSVTGF